MCDEAQSNYVTIYRQLKSTQYDAFQLFVFMRTIQNVAHIKAEQLMEQIFNFEAIS